MDEVKLPTVDEIRQLPRWARVAFAARCARRALPHFLESWSDAPANSRAAVEYAIHLAETVREPFENNAAVSAFHQYAGDTLKVVKDSPSTVASYAATAAFNALNATIYACWTDEDEDTNATEICDYSHAAAVAARWSGVSTFEILNDFELLRNRVQWENWNHQTAVPATVFPPITITNAIDTFAAAPNAVDRSKSLNGLSEADLVIRAFLRDGVDPTIAKDKLLAIYNAMNEYSIAKYGKAITIKDFQEHVMAGVPAGVCG